MISTKPIRVVLVDDHPLLREGVSARLSSESDIDVIGQGSTAAEAVRLAAELAPDVILLDIAMPGGGLSVVDEIAGVCPTARAVMFTANMDEEDMLAAFKAGAWGYVLKEVSGRELVGIVRRVHAGERYVPSTLAAGALTRMFGPGRPSRRESRPFDELTEREQQILQLLATGASNKEIGLRLHLTEKTVKYYTSTIFQKLNVRNRVEAALLVVNQNDQGG